MSSSKYEEIEMHSLVPFERTQCLTLCFTWTNSPLAVNVASLFESGKSILVLPSPPYHDKETTSRIRMFMNI
eukprot:12964954-Ditylum_brightwellii.AAC.1